MDGQSGGCRTDAAFDPFGDRTARDIRNTLSSALIAELSGAEPQALDALSRQWLSQVSAPVHRDYILCRQALYRRIVERASAAHIADPRQQAVLLWNAGLFFELHELLETIWREVAPLERTALKGLIQAAAVYVHLGRGKSDAAGRLAVKARLNLQTGASRLAFIANLESLLLALDSPRMPPPVLRGVA